MKHGFLKAFAMSLLLIPCTLIAQAPAGAPAGTTGKCKDGTYTSGTKKTSACRGHKGIAAWYANGSASPKSAAKSSAASPAQRPTETPQHANPAANSAAPARRTIETRTTAAAGGAPGLVWVNTSTKVYHCYGTRYYGKTKAGKYMSEADARTAGDHPENGKVCSK